MICGFAAEWRHGTRVVAEGRGKEKEEKRGETKTEGEGGGKKRKVRGDGQCIQKLPWTVLRLLGVTHKFWQEWMPAGKTWFVSEVVLGWKS